MVLEGKAWYGGPWQVLGGGAQRFLVLVLQGSKQRALLHLAGSGCLLCSGLGPAANSG